MAYNRIMEIIETSVFTAVIVKLMPDDEYKEMQQALVRCPVAGDIIKGSGGLRKLRWSESGRGGIQMKDSDFNNLVTSIKQAGKIRRGEMKPSRVLEITPLDVKQIREKLHKTQQEFALMIGISVATLRNWEQGRRRPEGPAMVLLKIAQTNPEAICQALLNA